MAKRSLVPETGGLRVVAIRWAGGGLVIAVSPTLNGLAVNPLLLTMIATVHYYRGALPRRRVPTMRTPRAAGPSTGH
jgi:hypothetical protein